jgi:hypothetical protein
MQEFKYSAMRESFFEGDLFPNVPCAQSKAVESPSLRGDLSSDEMMRRLDPRLRRVVVKACTNSYAASQVVEAFETYLLGVLRHVGIHPDIRLDATESRDTGDWWKDVLTASPEVTVTNEQGICDEVRDMCSIEIRLIFDAAHAKDGFNRLLFSAVGQFHGFRTRLSDEASGRGLAIRGVLCQSTLLKVSPTTPRLLTHIDDLNEEKEQCG